MPAEDVTQFCYGGSNYCTIWLHFDYLWEFVEGIHNQQGKGN